MSSQPDDSGYRVTYVGHATILIEIGGVRLLTDPAQPEKSEPFAPIGNDD